MNYSEGIIPSQLSEQNRRVVALFMRWREFEFKLNTSKDRRLLNQMKDWKAGKM